MEGRKADEVVLIAENEIRKQLGQTSP